MKFQWITLAIQLLALAALTFSAGCGGDNKVASSVSGESLRTAASTSSTTRASSIKGRRGLQAVFLNHWGPTSRKNLAEVINKYKNTHGLAKFEIAFAPYTKESPADNSKPVIKTDYARVNSLLNAVISSSEKQKMYVIVHFSFHADGPASHKPDDPDDLQMESRGRHFANSFLLYRKDEKSKYNYQRVNWIICPSLEDEYSTDESFKKDVQNISTGILDGLKHDPKAFSAVKNSLRFRRSRNKKDFGDFSAPSSIKGMTLPTSIGGQTKVFQYRVKRELLESHGVIDKTIENCGPQESGDSARYKVYSNDGNVVYSKEHGENAGTAENADKNPDYAGCKYELSEFINETKDSSRVILLWRHPYNLFSYNADRVFERGNRENATDKGGNTAFSNTEKAILEKFLRL